MRLAVPRHHQARQPPLVPDARVRAGRQGRAAAAEARSRHALDPDRGLAFPPVSDGPAIAISGLSKDYGSGRGLFDLDLEVRRGEGFGFLRPHGAGKSTTLRLLLDLIRPTAGSARVLDLDTIGDRLEVRRRAGFLAR